MRAGIPLPEDEEGRLLALRRYGLDAEGRPSPSLERVTAVAARCLDAPMAAISLVEEDEEWFASCHGIDPAPVPRERSVCTHTILADRVHVVEDVAADARFRDNPALAVEGIRFYAGAPLTTPDGYHIGALCVMDRRPRTLAGHQEELLATLAELVLDELELSASRSYLEHLEETSPVGVFRRRVDDSRIGYVSGNAQRLFGYPPQEMTGTPFLDYVHPDDREALQRVVERALAGHEETAGYEYRFLRKDGDYRCFHTVVRVLRGPDGEPRELLGYTIDITEQAALRRALEREREAAAHLRHLDELKNEFLTAVSHELRTPLTGVLGYAHTLERHDAGLSPEKRRDVIQRLTSSARKLQRLLTDLLDVDRLARGIGELRRRPTDLADLVGRVLAESEAVAERPVTLDAPTPTEVAVDAAKVERIVENLVVNAARYSPAGTRIWVRVRAVEGGGLVVVDDEGPGVPDDLKSTIFEVFQRGRTTWQHAPGTGVGLALVARFAQLHGGRAWVEDRPEGGASFRVLLPGEEADGCG